MWYENSLILRKFLSSSMKIVLFENNLSLFAKILRRNFIDFKNLAKFNYFQCLYYFDEILQKYSII